MSAFDESRRSKSFKS